MQGRALARHVVDLTEADETEGACGSPNRGRLGVRRLLRALTGAESLQCREMLAADGEPLGFTAAGDVGLERDGLSARETLQRVLRELEVPLHAPGGWRGVRGVRDAEVLNAAFYRL